jgi:nucleotide-binding universal stress UspA family protein
MLQTTLVAVVGSEYSKKVLDFACELAEKFGRLLLGSVSHKVSHPAPCTCITLH